MEMASIRKALDECRLSPPPSRKSSISNRLKPAEKRVPEVLKNVPRIRELIGAQLADAINACARGEADWPLLVLGPPGLGKTCAGLCVVDSFDRAVYFTPSDLHRESCMAERGDLYRNGYKVWFDEYWDRIAKASIVVLDELGLRSEVTDAHYETIKRLCDLRDFRPVIYLSNVAVERISEIYDARVLSRIACGTVVELEGDDRRFER